MTDRRFVSLARAIAFALAAGLAGCSGGGGSGSQAAQSQNNGLFGLFARRDPNADLTPEEGRELLADIRKDNRRLQKLTPGEKRFLAKASAAANGGS